MPAPSSRAMARSGRPGTAVAVRPTHLPARRPAPVVRPRVVRPSQPLPGRRSVQVGGKRYDRDQVMAVVSLALVGLVLLHEPEAATEVAAGAASDAVTSLDVEAPVAAPAVQAAAVLDVLRAQIGYQEGPRNANPYGDAYGMPNEPWCMQVVWWAGQQSGAGDLIPKTAYTPTAADWYRERGRFDQEPRVGSLAFFDWPGDSKKRIQHVEVVEAIHPDFIVTIGGNTSPGPEGSQDDGDGVWRRERPRDSSIVGYGHPEYAA